MYGVNLLFNGWCPEENRMLANGHKFCITELRGDWAWWKLTFRLTSSWNCIKHVCYRCNAQARNARDPGRLFWNEHGAWKDYTVRDFINIQQGNSPALCASVLLCVTRALLVSGPYVLLIGWHPMIMEICSMHVVGLGLQFDINGSALLLGRLRAGFLDRTEGLLATIGRLWGG